MRPPPPATNEGRRVDMGSRCKARLKLPKDLDQQLQHHSPHEAPQTPNFHDNGEVVGTRGHLVRFRRTPPAGQPPQEMPARGKS